MEQIQSKLTPESGKFTLGAFQGDELVGIVTFARETHPKTKHRSGVYGMYVSRVAPDKKARHRQNV
ncbi:hypothetical protein [Paenibacillus protaetiae]|uniref:GNAT family N-acetyltransferase n=1 Tax=Paenibacillus protaetiae TaxID=2509456 RepID=A0A4P6EWJ9_9BACL|nr:hypothetical protein [Paenibacillus protaetiae]QAY66109.1 hypothetical protein ET464_06590 [Paenibacillus protaetiae]